jgi:hypothetical protein
MTLESLQEDGFGVVFTASYNNIMYDNDVFDVNNDFDPDNNIYCSNGIPNEFYANGTLVFNGTIINQTLCDELGIDCSQYPGCNETLDDNSSFGGGGGLLLHNGWNEMGYPAAYKGAVHYTTPGFGNNPFFWHVHTRIGEWYDVKIWKFFYDQDPELLASNAEYTVRHKTGQTTKTVDWTVWTNEWVSLGTYQILDSPEQGVYLSDAGDGILVADAVRITSVPATTRIHKVAVHGPVNGSIAPT